MLQYKLMGLSPGFEGREFSFDERLTIGRSDDHTIVVKAPGISRHHVEVTVVGRKVMLKDLGSANGTKVNGTIVPSKELFSGDRITVAEMEFIFVAPAGAQATTGSTRHGAVPESGEATAFIDMREAVGAKPQESGSTEYINMGEVLGGQQAPRHDATEHVDMSQVLGLPQQPEHKEHATEYVDMSAVFEGQEEEQPAGGATAFIDMAEMVGQAPSGSDTTAKMSPFVLVAKVAGSEVRYEIPWGSSIVGKGPESHMSLNHDSVSSKHARIIFDGYNLQAEDAGAAAGVFVNLERVLAPRILKPGDELLIGRVSVYVRKAVIEESVKIDLQPQKKKGFFAWLLGLFGIGK
jgi:pSer/pThr/pTyr-binding forkhead associated (FHA) protein